MGGATLTGHRTAIWADRVFFAVKGRGAEHFLSLAARSGVPLSRLSCTENGYTGYASGKDVPRLYRTAKEARAELRICKRQGPGRLLERLAARPGLLVGLAVFFLLQWYLAGFVWAMDFGGIEPARQAYFREMLAGQEIWEGCRISEEKLRAAQETLELELQDAGWLSLNFTAGCLFVEENARELQNIRQDTQPQALYAKTGGQVLSVELESGFAEVSAGQYVAAGQLLANGQKADRKGQAVVQGASGHILGRIQKSYTAQQPLQTETQLLTGEAHTRETWYLLGHTWEKEDSIASAPEAYTVTQWLPLHLGRLALPGCLRRVTCWEKSAGTVTYTEADAQALAARSCRQQLLQEFPDARLETQALAFETVNGVVQCRAAYVFCAELTQPGPLAPLETAQGTS